MSGICGICGADGSGEANKLAGMLATLSRSGDGPCQQYQAQSLALGVSARWGFQNLSAVDGVVVAADADLVDLTDAAEALSISPASARSMPVSELIGRLFLIRGTRFLELLHGSFAIALWIERERRLLLAVDRMGIKTLYWRQEGQRVLFASRISAIRETQCSAPEQNPRAILQYLLFSGVPAPLTSDAGTSRMLPGTFISFVNESAQEIQYWDLEFPESDKSDVSYWADRLRAGMRSAVHRHLDSCESAQTGAFLSGGTDSSSVVAFMSEKFNPTQSFSIAFDESAFSEIEFARTTAKAFRTQHHELFLTPKHACDALDKILDYYDEPFANSSAVGTYYCAALAREKGVTTLLAGDGGDELFAGNERYATDKRFALYHLFPSWLRKGLLEPVVGLLPRGDGKLGLPGRYVKRANIPNPRRILSYGFFLSIPPEEIFEAEFLRQAGSEDWLAIPERHFRTAKASSELNRLLYLDVKMTLADNDLRKVCGTAELAGVNIRYPLLDERLAELSGQIPAPLKLRGFEKRFIFKQAMREILPERVLYKKKHGFGVPLAQWLLEHPRMKELMMDLLHDSATLQRGYFRKEFFKNLMDLHRKQPGYYGEIVWYLLVLEMWHRRHLDTHREAVYAQ